MKQTTISMRQKQTHRHGEQACSCQGGTWHGEFGISRCKLLGTWHWIGSLELADANYYLQNG